MLQISNLFRRRLQIIAITISALLTQNAPQTVWRPGSARTHNKQTVCLLLGLNSKYAARTPRELTGCVSCYNPSLKYGPVSSLALCTLSLPTPKIMAKFLWINPSVSLFTVTPENQQWWTALVTQFSHFVNCTVRSLVVRQIHVFLSRNCTPVNIVYHSRNADTEAFWQISSYYKKVTLYTKFGQLVLRKIIEIDCHQKSYLRQKCTKFDFCWGSALDPTGGS